MASFDKHTEMRKVTHLEGCYLILSQLGCGPWRPEAPKGAFFISSRSNPNPTIRRAARPRREEALVTPRLMSALRQDIRQPS